MKLLYTKRSPYARKVRIVALEKGIHLELIDEDLTKKSERLTAANPLGKIPTLILDNGETLCDSPVICQYLDSVNDKQKLIAVSSKERLRILHLEAIADGLMDVTVGVYLEKVRHPNDLNKEWLTAQEQTIVRTLKYFENHLSELQKLSLASIALASAIGYMNFRLPQIDVKYHSLKLSKWYEEISKRPSLEATKPVA